MKFQLLFSQPVRFVHLGYLEKLRCLVGDMSISP